MSYPPNPYDPQQQPPIPPGPAHDQPQPRAQPWQESDPRARLQQQFPPPPPQHGQFQAPSPPYPVPIGDPAAMYRTGPPQAYADPGAALVGALTSQERNTASMCHWLPLVVAVVVAPFTLFMGTLAVFLVPLAILFIAGGKSPYIRAHAAESVNFQLTLLIAGLLSLLLVFVFIGFIFLFVVACFAVFFQIKAAIKAGRGEIYRYPCIHFMH